MSRSLSYEQAEFELMVAPLSDVQKATFDAAARFWGERLRPALEHAAELCNAQAGVLMRAFWGAHQRFFKQLCVSLKVGRLVELVRAALANGECAVIGLQSTGEAALERALSADGTLSEPVSLCRSMLHQFVDGQFPTSRQIDAKLKKDTEKADRAHEQAKEQHVRLRAAAAAAVGIESAQRQAEIAGLVDAAARQLVHAATTHAALAANLARE